MNYNEALNYIHSLGNFSMPASLKRIKEVLEKLGNPQKKINAIHIAGTNGKGSVSAMIANVFKTAGYKTGLFISPFIIDFRERIQINGEYISENDLCVFAETVKETDVQLTEFEFITAVAFLYFSKQNVDILVCETGLGGRFDATNVLENKKVCVITKIGLDHTAILGNTIEKITQEKCGILRDCPVVTTFNQEIEALNVIKRHTNKLFIPETESLSVQKCDIGNIYIYKGKKYNLKLSGDYQIENALVAQKAVELSGYDISDDIICEGLKNTFFPARMEIISEKPLVVLDGAHNPDGANVLKKELLKHSGEVTAIIGMMKDKDYPEFLKTTLSCCENAVAVEVRGMPRSLSAEELCETANKYCKATMARSYTEAIEKARFLSGQKPIFVFGSLYLASEIRKILKEIFENN